MRRPRICMATDYYYPIIGGSEIQAYRLAGVLSKMGLTISVVTRKRPPLPDFEQQDGVRIYRIPITGGKKASSHLFLIQLLFFLLRNARDYDIIHCHLATSTALGCLIGGWITKTPVLIKLGGSGKTGDIQTSLATRAGRVKLGLLKRANCHFVAPSMDIWQEMVSAGFHTKRIKVIPNGVDTRLFSPVSPSEKGILKKRYGLDGVKLAFYAGRLEPEKDLLLMIDAWSRLDMGAGVWRLWIIGSGVMEDAIRSKIKEKGMEKEIHLLPSLPPDKVREYLRLGDLFLHPSRAEGLSNAILEAMSCGLPVIASRIDANQGLIKEGYNGLLFDPGNLQSLVFVLKRALEKPEILGEWGINGRNWVVENLDLSRIALSYIALYNQFLSGRFIFRL